MALADALEAGDDAVLLVLAVRVFLGGDLLGVRIGYRHFSAGKVFFPLVLEFLLELGIHRFTSIVIGTRHRHTPTWFTGGGHNWLP
jgi:hypothetical protein